MLSGQHRLRVIAPWKIAATYVLVAAVWIGVSDVVLARLIGGRNSWADLSIYKGWGFVAVTGLALYLVLKRALVSIQESQEALARSGNLLRYILKHNPSAIAVLDKDMRFILVSDRYLEDSFVPQCDVIGRSFYEIFPDAPPHWREVHKRCLAGAIEHFEEEEVRYPEGVVHYLRWECRPWSGPGGSIGGIVIYFELITERKRLEEQLRQALKMEAVGRLAGGVAHDFNNLLMVINGYGQLLLEEIREESNLQRSRVLEITKAGERAAALTRQLLAFSRKQILQPRTMNLNSVVTELEKMLQRVIGEDVLLVTITDPNLPDVKADPSQIEQVIMNLAVNARDAMPSGGSLTIETAHVQLGEEYVRRHPEVIPGEYVMLAVTDSGHGMDTETQRRAFEPFFTTKPSGQGTGLGLSTVYGIVKQSGGHVSLYSELRRGTTVKAYLPCCTPGVRLASEEQALHNLPRGTEEIIVAEDDAGVRGMVCEILNRLGYRVKAASGPREALAQCLQNKDTVRLLITDVIMPEVNGIELARRVRALNSTIRTVFMSGYTDNALLHHGVLEKGIDFLQKPFTTEALAYKVREVLDRAP